LAGGSEARPPLLLATHHKVLTKYFGSIGRTVALATRRRIVSPDSAGAGAKGQLIIDHHGRIDLRDMPSGLRGIHVRRNPRDVIVSSAFYHQKSTEAWLHQPREGLGGMTYQQKMNSFDSFEDSLLFEMQNCSRLTIQAMVDWDYDDRRIAEFKYEDLVQPMGHQTFRNGISSLGVPKPEAEVLYRAFRAFSVHARSYRLLRHVRDPQPDQWRRYFTPRVEEAFREWFASSSVQLGYD
jgi:hypothetical protein